MHLSDRSILVVGAAVAVLSVAASPVNDVVRSTASSVYNLVYGESADVACLRAAPPAGSRQAVSLALCGSDRDVVEHRPAVSGARDGLVRLALTLRDCDTWTGRCEERQLTGSEESVEIAVDPLLGQARISGRVADCGVDILFSATSDPTVHRQQRVTEGEDAGGSSVAVVLGVDGEARVDRNATASGVVCGHSFGPDVTTATLSRGVGARAAVALVGDADTE